MPSKLSTKKKAAARTQPRSQQRVDMPRRESTRDANGRDIYNLIVACKAIERTSERMRRPTLEFLWDKFVVNPERHIDKDQR